MKPQKKRLSSKKRRERRYWRQIAPRAGEKPGADWKKDLQTCGAARESQKRPTLVVDKNPNGKSRMKSKNALCGISIAVALLLGVPAGSAQTNIYLFSGSETNITLSPGLYDITAYGAQGGAAIH